jgi:hypothetical protein
MKQTTIKFEKKKQEPVTIQRLQSVVDAVAKGAKLNKALRDAKLNGAMGMHLVDARILIRLDGRNVIVFKPTLERKDFYRIMDLSSKHEKSLREKRKLMSFYEQKKDSRFIDVPDTDMLGLVNLPKTEPIKFQRTPKPRVKKAVALPWWKRILLYLANR